MRTIYKYHIQLADKTILDLPRSARPLAAQAQDGQLTMWVELDNREPTTSRTFLLIGTGHIVPDNVVYIGTLQQDFFVWHIYEQL